MFMISKKSQPGVGPVGGWHKCSSQKQVDMFYYILITLLLVFLFALIKIMEG